VAYTRLGLSDPEQSQKPVPLITAALLFSLIIAAGSIFFFGWLAHQMLQGDTARFDDGLRSFVHSFASPRVTKFMFAMSFMGSPGLIFLMIAAIVLCLYKKWYRALVWLVITMIGGAILDVTLKHTFHRARPDPYFGRLPQTFSFPSGHSLFSFCFYGVMAGLINDRVRQFWLKGMVFCIAIIMIALVGLSRIYLGVHYPSDVVAGYLTGTIWVSTMIVVDRLRQTKRGLKISPTASAK
jgi:undecaprenyl-diphosphatase